MTTKQVIYDMAKEHGYEGGEPRTTTEAINILADMLAGEDVEEGGTIKEALQALAPYVGGGGAEVLSAVTVFATPPRSIKVSFSEDGGQVAYIVATDSVVHGGVLPSNPSGKEAYIIAQHAFVELTYPTSTYTSVSVKTLYGDEYPYTTDSQSGLLYVRFMNPELGKDTTSPVAVTAS